MKYPLCSSKEIVSAQAMKVAKILDKVDISGFSTYPAWVSTSAFYNGRERGVALTVHQSRKRDTNLVVVFGEHRNSDYIFIDHWEIAPALNPPTVQDFTDAAYRGREFVGCGEYQAAADKVVGFVKEWLSKS